MEQQNKISEMQKKLMEELGLNDLAEEQQKNLIIKMSESVLKRIFLETLEKLNPEDQTVYEKMIEDNSNPEEVDKFLKEKIENYDKIVERVIQKFKAEMKNDFQK